jgi:hypothetical protein
LVKSNVLDVNSVNVGLSCYLVQRSYSSNSRNASSNNRRLVFNFEKPLISGGGLNKGIEIPFDLTIPSDVMTKIENSVMKAVVGVFSALSGLSRRYCWYVEARVDKKGFDIQNFQKINVN